MDEITKSFAVSQEQLRKWIQQHQIGNVSALGVASVSGAHYRHTRDRTRGSTAMRGSWLCCRRRCSDGSSCAWPGG